MISLTAIIPVQPGHEETVKAALLEVAAHVGANEPDTVGYYISQSLEAPALFTTYERFVDQAAMERHNDSAAVAKFFETAKELLAGEVTVHVAGEISAK